MGQIGSIIKRIKKLIFNVLLLSTVAMTISGCTYVNNKSWDDMTPEEREEVRQVFEEERKELEENEGFSDNSFAQYILDKVEEAIEIEN